MGRRGTELTAVSYISIDGAAPVRFDRLTPEVRRECTAKITENIGRTLSRYLSENPQEAVPILSAKRRK